jgi:hypothetical protein
METGKYKQKMTVKLSQRNGQIGPGELTEEGKTDGTLESEGLFHVVLDCGESAVAPIGEHHRAKAHEDP